VFTSSVHGQVEIHISNFLPIKLSYEEEMRRHPENMYYINALKDDLVADLKLLEAEFEGWKASMRKYAVTQAKRVYSKEEPTLADIESVLREMDNWGDYEEKLVELQSVCDILGDLAQALAHKKTMLEQLAQHERYQMSQYS